MPIPRKKSRFVPRNTTRNTVLAMLIVVLLVCGGTVTAVGLYFFRDTLTAKPRSPIETVEGFMQAAFTTRDKQAMDSFLCSSGASRPRKVVEQLLESEKIFGDQLMVTWEGLAEVSKTDDKAVVEARVTQSAVVNGNIHEGKERKWTFTLVNEKDWKVCEIAMAGAS